MWSGALESQPWSSSIILYNTNIIAHNHHTNNNPYIIQPLNQHRYFLRYCCCCLHPSWSRHIHNDLLLGSWLFLWGSLLATLLAMLLLLKDVITGSNTDLFDYGSGMYVMLATSDWCIMFLAFLLHFILVIFIIFVILVISIISCGSNLSHVSLPPQIHRIYLSVACTYYPNVILDPATM